MKRAFGPEALEASGAAAGILGALAVAMGVAGVASVKMAADMQASKTAFTKLLGDSQKAEQFLSELAQFAADTPFELPGLVDASKRLLAFQFAAQDVIPIMTAIGDAVALMGGGQEAIDGVVRAIGQISAKGKLSAEEVNQLAERNINAWKYVAQELGVSVPEAMKLTEQGAVDSTTAINGIIKGMQTEFKGGMNALSKEIPGLFSTIKDNAAAAMREVGESITDAFDIKGVMQGLANSLGSFAAYVKQSGVNQALRDLVPKELSLAIFVVAGALVGAAIPALIVFATSLWAAIVPLLPFIAYGAALAAVAWVIWQAWEPLGQLFGQVWTGYVATVKTAWANIIQIVLSGVQSVLGGLSKLVGFFNADWGATVSSWANSMQDAIDEAAGEADLAATRMEIAGRGIESAWNNTKTAVVGGANSIVDSAKNVNKAFTGLTNTGNNTDLGGGKAAKEAAKEWEKLESKAKQTSESIEREWVQTTKTQLEQLDIWKSDQLTALTETAAANENYERDKERVSATYSARRTKILQNEAQEALSLYNKMQDGWDSIQSGISGFGLKGSSADLTSMATEAQNRMKEISKYYADIQSEFTGADDAKKQKILANLNEMGIAYKVTEQGNLDFSKTTADQMAAIYQQAESKRTEYFATGQALRDDLQAAYNANDLAGYMGLLDDKNAAFLSQTEGEQAMMDVYRQVQMETNRSAISYLAEAYGTLHSGMTTAFTDMLTGAKSISEAFSALGKSIINMIAKWVAQWISGRIMMAIFGRKELGAETAASVAAAKVTAAAWAKAAAMTSLASFGGNAGPAMLGISATVGLASTLALVPMATGGIVTGPTPALIGEGRYDEAVIPLNKRMFEKLGFTGGGKSVQVTQNNYGDIKREVDYDQIQSDMGYAVGVALMEA
jgi:tape measure domain-containing protein